MAKSTNPSAVAHQINSLHYQLCSSVNDNLESAMHIGELLDDQQHACKHGDWEDWVAANVDFSIWTVRRYIWVFKNKERLKADDIFTLKDAYKQLPAGKSKGAPVLPASADSEPVTTENESSDEEPSRPKSNGKQAPKSPSKPKPVYDEIGTQIPSDALPFWNRRQEAQDLLTTVSKIKGLIQKSQEKEDPFFAKVSNGVIDELNRVYNHLLEAKPYAVCTTCMGSFSVQPKGCSFCGNKGLISKWQWDTQSRAEIKTIRIKAVAAARA